VIYRLRTFGGLAIEPDRPGLNQRKRLALLALLANAGESGITRDKIVSYLWPESDTERARNALYQLVFGIRRELGEDCIQSPGGEIKLGTHCLASDVAEFRQALDTCDLARAVAVYTGPFLDGIHLRDTPEFEEWSEATRRELQVLYHDALDRLAAAARETGDVAAGVRWTQLRSASEPVSTRAALSYMSALAAAGDRGAALQHAHVHAAIIRTQLDAEPGPEFERFVTSLRNGSSHASAPLPDLVPVLQAEQSKPSPTRIEPVVDVTTHTRSKRWLAVALGIFIVVVAIASYT
jgi:DNA-binding SARP family transcriptional activator